ncbi:MAG: SurA N-terminal domain-containing protein [Prevotellaceae bacterium]|jgi:peptidyl-prolyl cis-trans isomerase D|nr:SurA N-terminal domain-containing protein [Prevotellaceae bacterium]
MATLGKIRNHGVLLLIVIGGALLLFVLTGFFNTNDLANFFQGNKTVVGKIDGEKIQYQDFFALKEQTEDFYKIESGNDAVNEETGSRLLDETWNRIVMQSVLEKDADAIGMCVTKQELKDLTIGENINNISPIISQRKLFVNPQTGRFDVQRVIQLITDINNAEVIKQASSEQLRQMRNYWQFLESNVKTNKLVEKYNTLISKALVVNSLEAKYAFDKNQTSVDLVYAMKPYFAVADSTVTVSESEIKTLYNKRKEQFKQDEACDISYVVFPVKPSDADFMAAAEQINNAKEEFATTDDIMGVTNDFSDKQYLDIFLTKNDIDADLQDFAFSGAKDAVFGPILNNDTYKMARIVDNAVSPDSVKLSMIIVAEQTTEATRKKTDSIMNVLKSGANFAAVAYQSSMDKNTAAKGGEVGWFREVSLEKEIAEPAFKAAVNAPFVYENPQGYTQIFVVTEKTKPVSKVKLAVIETLVVPSKTTQAKIYQDAKQFAAESKTADLMPAIAAEKGYTLVPQPNVLRNTQNLGGNKGSREVIRWAFENKINTVSDVKECGNTLIVAGVTKKVKEGYRSFEDAKPSLEAELRKDKKFVNMKSDFSGKTIEQLAAENFSVDTVKSFSFASSFAGSLGNEPALAALAPKAEIDAVSAPVKGTNGAYVFKVLTKTDSNREFDAKQEAQMLKSQNQNIFYYLVEALKKTYKVKDERFKFF